MSDELTKIRHSLAHLLAAAILDIYGNDAKLAIGPAIDNGFYYDIEFPASIKINDEDLSKIEKRMRHILPTWDSFSHKEVPARDAGSHFLDNEYKGELVAEIEKRGEKITLYTSGTFTDLCRGGHVENPARDIEPDAFKLSRVAGAYWRGNEKNKMLTRIYGLAFKTKEELEKYEHELAEAKKRDHKKLGKELDLFTFSDLVGAGLPLWTPKGTIMRDLLDDYVWELRKKAGYTRVTIPHITKKDLYEKSGHWDKFKDELFIIKTREDHTFALKPMNCPHHTQIFARKMWSYREMPERYASTTMVYRDEQSGELSGLSRTRAFTQDDAHVFARPVQVKEEINRIWDIVHTFYGTFGFNLKIRLSLHDPKEMQKYLGTEEIWQTSESALREIVKEKGVTSVEAVGEAALYGPKIDFLAHDALGREWQVATVQLDMNLPERFDLYCINEKGEKERVVMLHAAIMGSIERFLSIIIEQYAGAFPLWLSPVQVRIVPVNDSHVEYATSLLHSLREKNIRTELDSTSDSLGKRVREAKKEKIPYVIIIGDKDRAVEKVTLENRTENLGQFTLEEVISRLLKEILEKK